MKTITIHGLDEKLEKEISKKARDERSSLNKTIKKILENALGHSDREERKKTFLDLCGVWSKAEERLFMESVKDLEAVLPEEWK